MVAFLMGQAADLTLDLRLALGISEGLTRAAVSTVPAELVLFPMPDNGGETKCLTW